MDRETREDKEKKAPRDEEYRARILSAARCLLEQKGIESINMYQIAQQAGIGQGTLYRRYEHPGEVFSDLFRASAEPVLDELEAQLAVGAPGSSALARLETLIVRLIQYIDDNAALLSFISCMYAGKKHLLPDKRPVIKRLHDLTRRIISDAVTQGEVSPVDVPLTAGFLHAALAPEHYIHCRDALGYNKEQYVASVRRIFVDGLRALPEKR